MDISDITDALVDADYAYNTREDVYTRTNRDGSSYTDVAIDAEDNDVTVVRYTIRDNRELDRKHFDLADGTKLQQLLLAIR